MLKIISGKAPAKMPIMVKIKVVIVCIVKYSTIVEENEEWKFQNRNQKLKNLKKGGKIKPFRLLTVSPKD